MELRNRKSVVPGVRKAQKHIYRRPEALIVEILEPSSVLVIQKQRLRLLREGPRLRGKVQAEPQLKLRGDEHAGTSLLTLVDGDDGAAREDRQRADIDLLEAEPIDGGQKEAVLEIHPAVID